MTTPHTPRGPQRRATVHGTGRLLVRNVLPPGALLVIIAALNFTLGDGHPISSMLVIVPLFAATLLGPRTTLLYGVLSVATWAALGLHDGQFTGATSTAQYVRGAGMVCAIVIAVVSSAVRVRRERRLQQVEHVAEVAQRAIIAPLPDRIGPVAVAARYESSAEAATVGGDFYAAEQTRFGVRVLLGDVRGKGLGAVRMASDVIGSFRERAVDEADPADLLERLHAAVGRTAAPGDFVTAALVQVDGEHLTVVNAGHLPPVLLRDGQAVSLLAGHVRPPLGLPGRAEPIHVELRPGDRVLLYTDGVTEARRPGDRAFRLDDDVLADALPGTDPADTVERVFGRLLSWAGGTLGDDAAVLALQFAPPQGAAAQGEAAQGEARQLTTFTGSVAQTTTFAGDIAARVTG